MTQSTSTITDRLMTIHGLIIDACCRFGRDPNTIRLLAASKAQSIANIETAYHAGQKLFGENYCNEAIEKIAHCSYQDMEWHFIGPIQSNKTKLLANYFHCIQSVDNEKIAARLQNACLTLQRQLSILIQVNVSEEAQKHGISIDKCLQLADNISQHSQLILKGLMAIPKATQHFDEQRRQFSKLKILFDSLNARGFNLTTLSMGMSNDFTAAIAEGSTLIRIGTNIFGPRSI